MNLAAIEASLRSAIGMARTTEDSVVPALVERLWVTLETQAPLPRRGDHLPAGWHAIFCLKAPTRAELGGDGLPEGLDGIPPVPMQRRMFGGARLTFHAPLIVGEPIRCESELLDVKTRTTATGHLAIVTMRHRYSGPNGLAVEELQDLINMEPIEPAERPAQAAAPAKAEPMPAATWQRRVEPDPIMLFRFSALTFNSHRIHYDAPYSAETEKLPGLMVQGKLIALQLIETARHAAPQADVKRFEYRSGRPLFAGRECVLKAALADDGLGAQLWAEDETGQVVQSGAIAFAEPVRA